MDSLAAKFIVFDGPDGCGKTTQRDLLAQHLREQGLDVVTCKDPGGTEVGDRIRHILLDFDLSEMDVRCEALLFMASRAQLVGRVIQPAIEQRKVVLCDRFVSATCAYQGAAGHDMQNIIDLAPYAIGNTWPDLTIVLDVEVKTGFERIGRKPHHTGPTRRRAGKNRKRNAGQHGMFDDALTDAMEARPIEFHRKVRQNFISLQNTPTRTGAGAGGCEYPAPVALIDTTNSPGPEAVHQEVLRVIQQQFAT